MFSLSLSRSHDQPPDRRDHARATDAMAGRRILVFLVAERRSSPSHVRRARPRDRIASMPNGGGRVPVRAAPSRAEPSPHRTAPRRAALHVTSSPRRSAPLRAAPLFPRALRLTSNNPVRPRARTPERTHSRRPVLAPHASTPRKASVVVAAPRGIPFSFTRSYPTAYSARRTPSWLHHRRCTATAAATAAAAEWPE